MLECANFWGEKTGKNEKSGEKADKKWGKGKEKAFKWLANHASDVHAVGLSLKRIAKVIQESDFTKLFDEKIEENADFLQNCGDFGKNEPVEDHVCFSIVDDKKKIDELEKGEKK